MEKVRSACPGRPPSRRRYHTNGGHIGGVILPLGRILRAAPLRFTLASRGLGPPALQRGGGSWDVFRRFRIRHHPSFGVASPRAFGAGFTLFLCPPRGPPSSPPALNLSHRGDPHRLYK